MVRPRSPHVWHLAFGILWRLAILALPWQTRWIIESGTLAGFPWEQGTVAAYASWGVLLLAVGTGLVAAWRRRPEQGTRNLELELRDTPKFQVPSSKSQTAAAALLVLLAVSLFTSSRTATLLWWTHVAVLSLFVWALVRSRVDRISLARWFVLALVPPAALGVWQFAAQDIVGSTILGIATQHPWVSGVSVVEHGLYRVLRAYGSFSHPNIFGGWLAVGLTLLPELARRARSKIETLWLVFAGVFLSLALILTFSRGAWLAALVGIGLAGWSVRRSGLARPERQAVALALFAILLAAGAGLVSQWDHVTARFRPAERLERWSLEQRKTALEEGVLAWLKRPLVGWGPGASQIAVMSLRPPQSPLSTVPPEPPHAVPLVVLVEMGALGLLAVLWLAVFAVSAMTRRQTAASVLPLAAALIVIALSDHYLWTLWPGQSLAALGWILLSIGSFTTCDNCRAAPHQEGQ